MAGPERPGAPSGSRNYTLPGGILINGKIIKDVCLKRMDGEVRQEIGKEVMAEDGMAIQDAILFGCVHSIGGGPLTRQIAPEMYQGDIDFISLKVAAIGANTPLVVDRDCPSKKCQKSKKGGSLYAEIPPDVIEVWTLEDGGESPPERPEKREDYDWKQYFNETRDGVSFGNAKHDGVRCFRIKDEELDPPLNALFRFPTGGDMHALSQQFDPEVDPIGFLYAMYALCLVEYCGNSPQEGAAGFGTSFVRRMPVDHLDVFDDEFPVRGTFGPETEQLIQCQKCNVISPVTISVTAFLLLGRRNKQRRKRST